MKIICVGRNYAEHAVELKNEVPERPLLFMKPPSSLLVNNKPFYIPDFTKDVHYEAELVIKVSKNGRHVQREFAHRYYDSVALGIDLTARDLQSELKRKGHPWEIAKGFDGSAPISDFLPMDRFDPGNIEFSLKKNGETVQQGNSGDMLFDFDYLICYISRFFKLQMGDLIFTGTPAGVGPIRKGDLLEGFIGGQRLLRCAVK